MKILYAAANNQNAGIQLSRFLKFAHGTHQIKIAAYKISSPQYTNVDWTLDALLNIYRPDLFSTDNDNLSIYTEQVKSFAPDLIISDLEHFTSVVARELNIPLWQCSSSMINFALSRKEKYNLGLFKNFAHVVGKDPVHTQRTVNIMDNADRNLIYSHYGDAEAPPNLQKGFEWVRPYHQVSRNHVPCQHFITAGLSDNDKRLFNSLKKYPDCVVFMERCAERYQNPLVKDIRIEDEYYCNLRNSSFFVCQGQTSFLADAFYNERYSLIYPNYSDAEAVTNSQISQKLGLANIMSYSTDINSCTSAKVRPTYLDTIKYLHEYIEEL
jgi:uncharacterized protein (TIGR00661 family)